jgi:putative ABC transport system substrate-binding protein
LVLGVTPSRDALAFARLGRRSFLAGGAGLTAGLIGVSVASGRLRQLSFVKPAAQAVTIGELAPTPDYPLSPVWQKMSKHGWTRGDNLFVEHRTGNTSTYPSLAAELVGLRVALIIAPAEPPARAAKLATSTIPIVFIVVDALASGLVNSLARPGGNVTGMSELGPEISAKNLDLLRELLRGIGRVAVLWSPGIVEAQRDYDRIATAAQAANIQVISATAGSPTEVPVALGAVERSGAEGLIVMNLVAYNVPSARRAILDFAAAQKLPAIYADRTWVADGGLMSYTIHWDAFAEREVIMLDKILRGADPGDLPVEQPTAFDLIVNAHTLQALGSTMPPPMVPLVTEWISS